MKSPSSTAFIALPRRGRWRAPEPVSPKDAPGAGGDGLKLDTTELHGVLRLIESQVSVSVRRLLAS